MHWTFILPFVIDVHTIGHVDQEHEEYRGPQASSYKDTNIVVIKVSPDSSHPIFDFYFLINIFMLRMIVH